MHVPSGSGTGKNDKNAREESKAVVACKYTNTHTHTLYTKLSSNNGHSFLAVVTLDPS
jgi:hypothetical protein